MADAAGFEAFYRAEYGRLAGALRLMCGDRQLGEELAQEAMVKAWRSWDRVRGMERPGAWVTTVGVNLVRRQHRRRRRPWSPLSTVDVEAVAGSRVDLAVALSRLPVDQRTVVVVRHVLGYPTAEAAEMLDRSDEAVRALLARAVRAMRVDLAEMEENRT